VGITIELGEEIFEGVLGEQTDVFGEHGEEAALQKTGDDFGVMTVGFERLGEPGKAGGDVAGDFGGFFRRVEGVGICPDRAETLADLRTSQVGQSDAVILRIWKALVVAAGAGELGIKVDTVADVADDEKGRASLSGRQGSDVGARLVEGPLEGAVKGGGAAFAMAGFGGGSWPG
jgi:hypothetical protein